MPDRTLVYGDPADAGTKYRSRDDDPAGGGNFVVAEDTDNNTVLLQYNPTASQWEYAGPVDMGSNDISNAGTISADALEAETVATDHHFAGSYDGSDAPARLDNALAAASAGDKIFLENLAYTNNRTISKRVTLLGSFTVSQKAGTVVKNTWTLDDRVHIYRISNSGTIKITTSNTHISEVDNGGTIEVADNRAVITGVTGGNVTFQSGTSGSVIDSSNNMSITDNGSNTVGDIA